MKIPICQELAGLAASLAVAASLTADGGSAQAASGQAQNQPQTSAIKVQGAPIFQANPPGGGSPASTTYMIATTEGNVIVDTSVAGKASEARRWLRAENPGPIKYIILTHGHPDHTGGISSWKESGTQIIVQRKYKDFIEYQARLGDYFKIWNKAQWPSSEFAGPDPFDATIVFDDMYEFTLGAVKFELYATASETPDALTVWLPQYKAAFSGDTFYGSFPNMYTLRGTTPRYALDYIGAVDRVLELKPEILLPSHGAPIYGNAEITRRLSQYREAIQYVHDEVVKGMNAGKDVFTLMREIKLPAYLAIRESYGAVPWSVRGIYEGYVGWFDRRPATMYGTSVASVYPDIVRAAGGANAIASLASERFETGELVESLHLTEIALTADPNHRRTLEVRLRVLQSLLQSSDNSNEKGWLQYFIGDAQRRLNR